MNKPKDSLRRFWKATCALALFFLSLTTFYFSTQADDLSTQAIITIDLGTSPTNVATIIGANDEDHIGGNGAADTFAPLPRSQALVAGDFNDDGIQDLAFGAPDTDFTPPGSPAPPNRANTGAVYIVFGRSPFTVPVNIDTNIAGANQPDIKIYGAASNDQVGFSLAVGDINNDGSDDLLIGAPGVDGPGATPRTDSGAVYIMLGDPNLMPKTIDLAAPNAISIIIFGERSGDNFGAAVASGEVGGTGGSADIFVGAPANEGPDEMREDGGAAYVLYGGSSLTPNPITTTRVFDLGGATPVPANVKLYGAAGSAFGSTVAIGDINGATPADLIIGAPHANRPEPSAATDTGAVYIAYGGDNLLPMAPAVTKIFDTTLLGATPNTSIYGTETGDHLGAAVAAGEVTGDSIADLIIGAPDADGPLNARANAGETYLITGSANLTTTARINLSMETANLTIFGAVSDDRLGSTVAVGRLNSQGNTDGISELLVGAPGAANNRGAISAFYGGASLTILATRDLALGQDDLRVNGQAAGDELGWSIAALDLDNNRGGDLAIGAPFANLAGGAGTLPRDNAGKVYVIFAASANVPPVNEPPVVQVSAPNGGEILPGGTTTQIAWTATDPNGDASIAAFEIRLSIDGGTTFNTIVAPNVAGTARTFTWNVPTGLNTTMARIRIIALDNTGLQGQDESNANFSIIDPGISVVLTSPNGGEQLKFGQTVQITWVVPEASQALVRGFDLFLSTDGGANFNVGIASNPLEPAIAPEVRSFEWMVPRNCATAARVLVVATSTTGARSSDASNGNFTITDFGPTVDTNKMFLDLNLERMVFRTVAPPIGNEIFFAQNATVEVSSDEAGTAFFTFAKAFKYKNNGKKVVNRGLINGQGLLTFFPNNAVRIIRITNPPCGITILRVRRNGDVLVIDNPAPGLN